jgi:hypothetical protein
MLSGNSSTMQESYSVHEGQNGLSELKKPDLFYSNFLNLDGLSQAGNSCREHFKVLIFESNSVLHK